MARMTKAELERENVELREKLYALYEELGDFLDRDEDESDDEDEEGDEE